MRTDAESSTGPSGLTVIANFRERFNFRVMYVSRERFLRLSGVPALAVFAALAASGCERIVDVELPSAEPRLVVEGRVELNRSVPGNSGAWVRLTVTGDYFDSSPATPVTDAEVRITDQEETLAELSLVDPAEGVYVHLDGPPLAMAPGYTYQLEIRWDGDTYLSDVEMAMGTPIDSLYFEWEEEFIGRPAGLRVKVDYTDPPGPGHSILYELFLNGEPVISPFPGNEFRLVRSDRYRPGEEVTGFAPDPLLDPDVGDRVTVRQVGLTTTLHDYMLAVFEQNALGLGNPYSIPSATIQGNVVNSTSVNPRPLGYFGAHEVFEATVVVPDTLIP